jgi:trehalose-6-phosphate synthase
MWTKEGLLGLIHEKLCNYKFILVSNREPYMHRFAGTQIECVQPASGLTVALDPIMRACGGTWIAHGTGDADWQMVDERDRVLVPPDDPSFTLRLASPIKRCGRSVILSLPGLHFVPKIGKRTGR